MKTGHDRLIVKGFLASFTYLFLAKISGAVKEVVVAHAFGTAPIIDAYSLAFTIANWPISIATVTASSILIPILAVEESAQNDKRSDVTPLIVLTGLFGLLLSSFVFFLFKIFGNFLQIPSETAVQLSDQSLAISLMIPFGLMGSVLAARLMASRNQISSLFEAIPALTICIAIWTVGGFFSSASVLSWATFLGMGGYFAALVLVDRSALSFTNKVDRLRVSSFRLSVGLFIVIAAQIAFSLGGVLTDQVSAVGLSYGDNATLAYTNRLLMLATSLGATAIGRAVMPVLAQAEASGDSASLIVRWALRLFLAGIIIAVLGWLLAPWAVRIVFERGQFSQKDTEAVSNLLRIALWQLPFYFSGLLLSQVVVIRRQYLTLFIFNVSGVVLKLSIVAVFLREGGAEILMYGTAAMYLFTSAAFASVVFKRG